MSQVTYRGNLSAKSFPMISENFGRSIIVKQYDQNFNRQLTSAEDNDKDIGIPQLYYGHNVMPSPEGIQSVGYLQIFNEIAILPANNFIEVYLLQDINGNQAYLGVTSDGEFYIYNGVTWVLKTVFTPGIKVSIAHVSGVTYIYVAGSGCYHYDFGLGTFVPDVLAGLVIVGLGAILGICPSAGYMIAWSINTIYWSSTLSPIDFVPSLVTGAGSGALEGAKGNITICVPHLLGFIAYTTKNAVAALYSGNSRFPYNFREIVASGGLASFNLVAFDASTGNHYAYTTSGFQLINTSQASTVFPELTDFIAGKLFEDFDTTTNTFSTIVLSSTMAKKITVVSDRYLVISYGVTTLTHAIVYDLVQKRYGKLKFTHTSVFEFQVPSAVITEIPRQSFALLTRTGSVYIVDFSVSTLNNPGVAILGKYQFVRPRLLQLDEINLENIRVGATFSLTILSALDGKNYTQSTPYLAQNSVLFRKYQSRAEGLNHSLLFKGSFELCSLVLVFDIGGKR